MTLPWPKIVPGGIRTGCCDAPLVCEVDGLCLVVDLFCSWCHRNAGSPGWEDIPAMFETVGWPV